MGLGTDLLKLRRSRFSSMEALLAGMDRLAEANSDVQIMNRAFALNALADAVLTNVAVHAMESDWSEEPLHKQRRAANGPRRRIRRSDPSQLYQRRLFA